jgi:transposase InsO family protein
LQKSEKWDVYILTIVDVCTGYVVLRQLRTKDMEAVARKLWRVMCEYGTPKIVQSDNGSEFANQTIKALSELYGIEQQLITAYNPRSNGLVERTNKEVS